MFKKKFGRMLALCLVVVFMFGSFAMVSSAAAQPAPVEPQTVSSSMSLYRVEVSMSRREVRFINVSAIPAQGDFGGTFDFQVHRDATLSGSVQAQIPTIIFVPMFNPSINRVIFAGVARNHVPAGTVVATMPFTGNWHAITGVSGDVVGNITYVP